MTLGELGLWMESAIELLLSGNFKQLTIEDRCKTTTF
jgi:hypothetical protein